MSTRAAARRPVGSGIGSSLCARVRAALDHLGPVRAGEVVVVGVSGGPDSLALLHLLARIGARDGFRVHAAHFDHGLRGEASVRDARFVRETAEAWAIPFTLGAAPAGSLSTRGRGLQAAARAARYAFFERVADETGARWVATAHTADDQAETVVMRWVRGAGAAGLAGIPGARGHFIRPLLGVSRPEIEASLAEIGVTPLRDPSNHDPRFLRTAVRHEILPALRAINPRAVEALARGAALLADDAAWLDACAGERLISLIREAGDGWIELAREGVAALHPALRRRVIRFALARVRPDATDLAFETVEAVSRGAASARGGRVTVGRGLTADFAADRIRLGEESAVPAPALDPVALPAEGELALPEWGIVVAVRMEAGRGGRPRGPGEDPYEAAFDIDRLPGMLGVRSRRPGDRFHPEGMMGRKRLQDFFTDTRVPRWRRDRVPLLVAGGDVLWVIGVRRDRRYLASGTGRTVVVRVRHDTLFHPHRAPAGREVGSAARQSSSETT